MTFFQDLRQWIINDTRQIIPETLRNVRQRFQQIFFGDGSHYYFSNVVIFATVETRIETALTWGANWSPRRAFKDVGPHRVGVEVK